MIYSDEFKKRARDLYPDNKALHEALEREDHEAYLTVNNILHDPVSKRFSPEDILKLLDKDPNELAETVAKLVTQIELFKDWQKMYSDQPLNQISNE